MNSNFHAKIILFFLMLLLIATAYSSQTVKQTSPSGDQAKPVVKTNADKNESQDKELEFTGKNKSVKIHYYQSSPTRYNINIDWIDGSKNFLFFRGKKYRLELYHNTNSEKVSGAVFTLKDTSNNNDKVSLEHTFNKPFEVGLAAELDKWHDAALATIEENKEGDAGLIEQFDLRPFYRTFVKSEIVKYLDK